MVVGRVFLCWVCLFCEKVFGNFQTPEKQNAMCFLFVLGVVGLAQTYYWDVKGQK